MSAPRANPLVHLTRSFFIIASLVVTACTVAPEAPPPPEVLAYPPPPEPARYYFDRTITGSGDVQEDTAADRLRRFATGESRRGRGFDKPFDIAAVDGRIFLSDTVARRIYAFDYPRKKFYEFGTKGVGRLVKPLGLAADKMGKLYICDGGTKRVQIYDFDGNHIRSIGDDSLLTRPSGVAVNADGSRIYVIDTGGIDSDNHRVRAFDASGNHLFDIGERGPAVGQFNLPLNATVGPNGNLYVLDTGNFRVQVFSPDGKFLFTFGAAGRRPGSFSHPKGIAVDDEGKIFVADTAFGNFQIFDPEGRILLFIGDRQDDGGPGKFILPAGIAVDHDGRVYMVDQFFRKVDVFRPAGLPEDSPIGLPMGATLPQTSAR
jgi:DNA-binding beta-propeller fold protein YncE